MPTHALLRPALRTLLLLPTVLVALLVALLAGLLGSAPAASADPLGSASASALRLPEAGPRVLAVAAAQQGKPYVWGTTGPSTFDCSGYVRYVFSRLGKSLPRTSGAQYAASRRIAKADKQPGDLIFTRSGSGRINHVGIYAGSGTFWVAPKAGDVVKRQKIYTSNYAVGRV